MKIADTSFKERFFNVDFDFLRRPSETLPKFFTHRTGSNNTHLLKARKILIKKICTLSIYLNLF